MNMQSAEEINQVQYENPEMELLDSIINENWRTSSVSEKHRARDLIRELVDQVLDGTVTVSKDVTACIDARIAELDKLISDQLNEVMHSADFQNWKARGAV